MKTTKLLLLAIFMVNNVLSQDCSDFKSNLTAYNLKSQVERLCENKSGNRVFSTVGEQYTANYIREQFIKSGLNGYALGIDNFFQN